MEFLLVAIPIIFLIIISILGAVFLSNSRKYLDKLDTAKKLELEKFKKEAIERINDLKSGSNKQEIINKRVENQKQIMAEIQKQNKTVESITETIRDFKKNISKEKKKKQMVDVYNKPTVQSKTLVFNQKNLVRGLIANEYLHKRNETRRR